MSRLFGIIFTFILLVTTVHAQEFGQRWICAQEADSSSQWLFKKTWLPTRRIRWAKLAICSTGRYQVNFNEHRLSRDVLLPSVTPDDSILREQVFDLSALLRNDSNTVAVWYSPIAGRFSDKQLSVTVYGRYADGRAFAHTTDDSWLCKPAWGSVDPSDPDYEAWDAKNYDPLWKGQITPVRGWSRCSYSQDRTSFPLQAASMTDENMKLVKVFDPESVEERDTALYVHFPRVFYGWVRLTIRGARRGEEIYIDDYQYTCNGNMDEQACRRFTAVRQQDVVIVGDRHFRPSQIQSIEGVEIAPIRRDPWEY
ncbi:alpha-L-rhamnosidase N-terminal domain-containing protein [Prevotella sp. AGR2160]|uniref:alpha-L-rhamnosidase N-terminal domain-containing protein n=1 Tax=Prevotella sp. AGR2160 TaxID=1280674 RepID=UPI00041DBE50|nr:alpha-L-rhamnosidase N-terminal domain-containing protein [Prevotella sp. AGR2160]